MRAITAAVIGLGVGEHHVKALHLREDVQRIYICDFRRDCLDRVSRLYPKAVRCTSDQELQALDAIDLVSICSYDQYHYHQASVCFATGRHIFVEKPFCLSWDELESLFKLAQSNPEVKVSSNMVLRSAPRFKRLKQRIKEKELGEIFYIEGDYYWGRKEKLFGWRADTKNYSIILGAAIHMIDLIIWLTNQLPTEVYASGNQIATKETNFSGQSFVSLFLYFENGLIAKVTGNGGCIYPHSHAVKTFGTKGTVVSELDSAYVVQKRSSGIEIESDESEYPAKELRREIIDTFVDSIINATTIPAVTKDCVFNTMAVCLAAEVSLSKECRVRVKYLK